MRSHGALEAEIEGNGGYRYPRRGRVPPLTSGSRPRRRCPSRIPRGADAAAGLRGACAGGDTSCRATPAPGGSVCRVVAPVPLPPKCPRGRRRRPVPSRLLPGVENIPSCDRAPAAPGGEDPPRSPPAPGRAPAPVPPFPGRIHPRDSHGGSRWGRQRRKCPAGSGRAPITKAGNEAAGTRGRAAALQSPPRVPLDPTRGLCASFPPPFPGRHGILLLGTGE